MRDFIFFFYDIMEGTKGVSEGVQLLVLSFMVMYALFILIIYINQLCEGNKPYLTNILFIILIPTTPFFHIPILFALAYFSADIWKGLLKDIKELK